jgi:autotransporter-associated beta strand protein
LCYGNKQSEGFGQNGDAFANLVGEYCLSTSWENRLSNFRAFSVFLRSKLFNLSVLVRRKNSMKNLKGAIMKFIFSRSLVQIICLPLLSGALAAQAQNIYKAATATMSVSTDWTTTPGGSTGIAPSASYVGEFGGTPTQANLSGMALGGAVNLAGLQLDNNMAGPLTITADGNALTLGANGINMSAANQSATFGNLLALGTNQTWLVASGQTNTVNGVVSGSSVLTVNDGSAGNSGTVFFGTQSNTYTGGTLIEGGVVQLGNAASLGAGAITNAGGILVLSHAGISPVNNDFVISNICVIDDAYYAGNENLNGAWSGGGTVTISNMATYSTTFTIGVSSSTASMAYFSGKIIIAPVTGTNGPAEGTLRFNSGTANNTLGSTGMSVDLGAYPSAVSLMQRNGSAGPNGVVFNVGELKGGSSTSVIGSRQSNSTITYSIGGLGTSTTFAGTITNSFGGDSTDVGATGGVCAITKVGAGTLTLTGTNYYTGNTTFSGGVLCAGSGEATVPNTLFNWAGGAWYGGPFGEPTNLVQSQFIFNGGTLQYSAANQFDYSPRFSTAAGQDAISIDVNGQNVTFGTALAGSGGSLTNLDSAGGGRLILTQPSTYTGGTTVNGGTLLVNNASGSGTGSGSVTVNSGATLGGSGAIAGAVTCQSGGILAPGAGVGTAGTVLTVNAGVTMSSGSSTVMAVSHSNKSNDQIACVAIVYGGTLTVTTNAGDAPFVAGDSFQLFKANSSAFYAGSFSATNLPALSPGLGWSNSLAANGSIEVTGPVASTTVLILSSGSNPSTYSNLLTFNATVNPTPTNGETIYFLDGSTTIGTGITANGVATFSIGTLGASTHSITAVYPGDASNYGSTSSALSVTVNMATPTITTAPAASVISYGQTLAASSLSGGVASVPGSFAFTTPSTAPNVGTALQSVTFTPMDMIDYNTITTNVSVTVIAFPPVITLSPKSQTATLSSNVSFYAAATGSAPLSYQWRKNGVPISGATSTAFSISSVGFGDAGNYDVIISNIVGTVVSIPTAELLVTYLNVSSTTNYIYDALGRLIKAEQSSTNLVSYIYDNANNLTFAYPDFEGPDVNGNGIPDAWEIRYFGSTNVVGYDTSSNQNWATYFLDYALGYDPTSSAPPNTPTVTIRSSGGHSYMYYTYQRDIYATQLNYVVQVSQDLINWQTGTNYIEQVGVPIDNQNGTETVTLMCPTDISNFNACFVRLGVVNP